MEDTIRSPNEPMRLRKEDLPATYQAANQTSVEAQGRFLRRSAVGLIMVVLAAGAGSFVGYIYVPYTSADVMSICATAAFGTALVVRISLLTDRPHKTWYGGRAAAESAKTLAWRYAVGGAPFQIDQNSDEVGLAFTKRLEDVFTDLGSGSLVPPSGIERQITQRMRKLRAKSLEERKEAYRFGRIADQLLWYSRKARWNKERSQRSNVSVMFLVILGLWSRQVRRGCRSNYTPTWQVLTRSPLSFRLLTTACLCRAEEDWARFVGESEDAISRVHTLWRAREL